MLLSTHCECHTLQVQEFRRKYALLIPRKCISSHCTMFQILSLLILQTQIDSVMILAFLIFIILQRL